MKKLMLLILVVFPDFTARAAVSLSAEQKRLIEIVSSRMDLIEERQQHMTVSNLITVIADIDFRDDAGNTPFMLECASGRNDERYFELLFTRSDVSVRNKKGQTALHLYLASGSQHLPVIERIIAKGADINARDNIGATALIVFMRHFNFGTNTVEGLLALGADMTPEDTNGLNALAAAVDASMWSAARMLSAKGSVIGERTRRARELALIHAAYSGDYARVKDLLVKKKVNPVAVNADEREHALLLASGPPLYETVQHVAPMSDIRIVALLLSNKVSVDMPDKWGSTPLMHACHTTNIGIIDLLIARGASVNKFGGYLMGESPLINAVMAGNEDVVRFLITKKAKVNYYAYSPAAGKDYPLARAMRMGHSAIADMLLANGADANLGETNASPLLCTVIRGDGIRNREIATNEGEALALVKNLVHHMAQVNGRKGADDPLYAASEKGYIEVMRFLIENGARMTYVDHNGNNAVYAAARYGHVPAVEMLVEKGMPVNSGRYGEALTYALSGKHHAVARYLIEHGANIHTTNEYGMTPLHQAVNTRSAEIAQLLITRGANTQAKDHFKKTPADAAAASKDPALIALFPDAVKKAAAVQRAGSTQGYSLDDGIALLTAAKNGDLETARKLCVKGGNINFSYGSSIDGLEIGYTPLMMASRYGHEPIVRLFLDNGALITPNTFDNNMTAKHYAQRAGHTQIAALLTGGADTSRPVLFSDVQKAAKNGDLSAVRAYITKSSFAVNMMDSTEGKTLLMIAAQYGRTDIVEHLLSQPNIMVNVMSKEEKTALEYAEVHGQTTAAALIRKKLGLR
ncbi:MAG: ankyrin repeat domain-containing protein [Spirochaetota bacterium]